MTKEHQHMKQPLKAVDALHMKQPLKAVDALLQTVEKQFGKGAMMRLGDRKAERVPCIPTGSPSLDEALGCGGYPKGRVVEVFGPESSGKTTLTLHAIAQCQAIGGVAAFIDAEHALDIYYAKNLGVNAKELLVSQPDNGEQALDITETLVRSGAVDLVHMGLQARLMSQALRKLAGAAHRTGTTIVFINQLRMKIGVVFGSPETTTGGHALKYYASVRLDIRRIGAVKQGESILGNRTRVKVVKNKLAPPFQKAEFDIRYGKGIDAVGDLLDRAVEANAVEKSGAYYRFGGKNIAQGRENARTAIEKDDKLREAIAAQVQAPVKGARTAA
jgi:recombination protein RecA